MKFIVDNRGDPSVGINPFQVEVEVKYLDNFEDEFVTDFIESTKAYLKDWFDQETSCKVYTEQEYQIIIDFEDENLGG